MKGFIIFLMFAVCIITCVLILMNASGIIPLVSCIVIIALAITLDIIQNKEDQED
ncbi:MAG: hypothetical protein IIW92_06230 [Lachnospiraceae bacterium]|nr:hypothetical protein [Lachnospiraceae bacterium]